MARKKHEEHENHERWLVSYADFITLLFAFFTTLYAIGESDRAKAVKFVTSINTAFNRLDSTLISDTATMGGPLSSPLMSAEGVSGGSLASILPFPISASGAGAIHQGYEDGDDLEGMDETPQGFGEEVRAGGDGGANGTGDGGDKPQAALPDSRPGPAAPASQGQGAGQEGTGAGQGDGGGPAGLGGYTREEFEAVLAEVNRLLEQSNMRGKIAMHNESRGVVISLSEAGLFQPGQADLMISSLPYFDQVARMIKSLNYHIQIEGHTDNTPIRYSSFASNRELSAARAVRTMDMLVKRYGIDPSRILTAGWGEHRPVADNATAEGRARNRRIDIVILGARIGEEPKGL